jgi:hypothetical protein
VPSLDILRVFFQKINPKIAFLPNQTLLINVENYFTSNARLRTHSTLSRGSAISGPLATVLT